MDLDKPDAGQLLQIACQVLSDELLPVLPADKRYTGLMLANALRMAGRELDSADCDNEALEMAWQKVYEEFAGTQREQRLARDIRAGRLSIDDAGLRALLKLQTVMRLRLSNPKHLRGHGLE